MNTVRLTLNTVLRLDKTISSSVVERRIFARPTCMDIYHTFLYHHGVVALLVFKSRIKIYVDVTTEVLPYDTLVPEDDVMSMLARSSTTEYPADGYYFDHID